MTDVASTEQKPKGGRPTVGVTAQRVKAELVELREKEKQRRLQTQAKREELKRLMALATARDRRIQAGKERKEEKQLTFVLGQLLLKALAQPGVAQVVVRLPEIEALKEEVKGDQELVRILRRQLDMQRLELKAPARVTLFQSADGPEPISR